MIPKYIITSPNENFTNMVLSTTEEVSFNDFMLIESAFDEAVEQVLKVTKKHNISVIVSRGVTAKMIKNATDIPVIEAEATLFDLLSAIIQAMKISKNIALIHHEKILNEEFFNITGLFNINLKEYCYRNFREIEKCVSDAYDDKKEVIVSGFGYTRKL